MYSIRQHIAFTYNSRYNVKYKAEAAVLDRGNYAKSIIGPGR